MSWSLFRRKTLSRWTRNTIDKFDAAAYAETVSFLEALKKYYVNRYNEHDQRKEKKIDAMITAEKEKEFESLRQSHQNEAITELVKNMAETNRIIEKDARLIQKFYPIYKEPDPDHMVDFDAQFYMPAKHFLNQNIDTFYFNIGVIWSMTLILAITLYYEVLKKIVDGLSNISSRYPQADVTMFFVVSKVLAFLAQPLAIVVLLLIVSWVVRNARWKKIAARTAFVILLFTSNYFISNEVMKGWETPITTFESIQAPYDYGILLTGVTNTEMKPKDRVYFNRGADRATHTLQLYKLGLVKKVIISGGSGRLNGTGVREADDLADFLMLAGMPREDIIIENISKNTHESSVEVKKILDQIEGPKKLVLITSGYHMKRSLACFRKENLQPDHFATNPISQETRYTPDALFIPSLDAMNMWQTMLREWVGFVAYWLAGYI